MKQVIEYFTRNHLIANLIVALVVIGGLLAWYEIRKEEYPDFSFDTIRITTAYPGAAPQEVEQAITLPLEHELSSLDYIRRIESTSRRGSSIISLELQRNAKDLDLAVTEIQNRILAVKLPSVVEELPKVRYRKTSQKAVIDVAFYLKDKPLLGLKDRRSLQKAMRDFENQLLKRPEISMSDRDAYLTEEIHIQPRVNDLYRYRINLSEVRKSVLSGHTDLPLGIMNTAGREQVRVEGRLEKPADFHDIPLRSSFVGNTVRLKDIAETSYQFQDTTTLVRVNGYESVIFNVVKSTNTGILEAVDAVNQELTEYLVANAEKGIHAVLLDDESYGVRNRLSIISGNAAIGFALIMLALSFFLNPRAAFWVSLGIPFSFLFTLLLAYFLDYTVNNMTLAAVIIAMGMLVDDAIVVSENITRLRNQGMPAMEASIEGTREVFAPIVASILTTIAAFLPLLAFDGRLALLTTTIPPIVGLILAGSLIESLFILPGHLTLSLPGLRRNKASYGSANSEANENNGNLFLRLENFYSKALTGILHHRLIVLLAFAGFILIGLFLFQHFMSFSLFPREKVATAFIIGETGTENDRYGTLDAALPLEQYLLPYIGKEFVGVRTTVGYRRYRPSDEENIVSLRIEFDEDKLSATRTEELIDLIEKRIKKQTGFKKLKLSTRSFGSDTGSALEILVQENDNNIRYEVAEKLAAYLRKADPIEYVEVDKPASEFEYVVYPDRTLINRLEIDPADVETCLRSALSGLRLYSFYEDNEEIHVRLRFADQTRNNINKILKIPASNRQGYQVPLGNLVQIEQANAVSVINRVDQRRVLKVNADINKKAETTPLAMAKQLESGFFKELRQEFPSVSFTFEGEVKNTRESTDFFQYAVLAVLFLIFFILAIQFRSTIKPLIIMIAIIPTWVSIVFVFLLHGREVYGFFAVVGALGLSGIVVNGAILLLDRLDRDLKESYSWDSYLLAIATLSATRLRAVLLTTITTVAGLLPTAYGVAGYDSMLSEMMLAIAWGLVFSVFVTLGLVPVLASFAYQSKSYKQ